jgi:hypothetical protein
MRNETTTVYTKAKMLIILKERSKWKEWPITKLKASVPCNLINIACLQDYHELRPSPKQEKLLYLDLTLNILRSEPSLRFGLFMAPILWLRYEFHNQKAM